MMASALLIYVDIVLVVRLFIVADASYTTILGHQGITFRAVKYLTSLSSERSGRSNDHTIGDCAVIDVRAVPPRFRTIHLHLFFMSLAMGLESALNIAMNFVAKTDQSCKVQHAVMEFLSLLGVLFLILFLLSKLDVTNSHHVVQPLRLEQGIVRLTKAVAFVIYPTLAVYLGFELTPNVNSNGECGIPKGADSLGDHDAIIAISVAGLVVEIFQVGFLTCVAAGCDSH
ncbi:unnamed protein product [Choristocarpus tenellus]